jgi:hypothetical protein
MLKSSTLNSYFYSMKLSTTMACCPSSFNDYDDLLVLFPGTLDHTSIKLHPENFVRDTKKNM